LREKGEKNKPGNLICQNAIDRFIDAGFPTAHPHVDMGAESLCAQCSAERGGLGIGDFAQRRSSAYLAVKISRFALAHSCDRPCQHPAQETAFYSDDFRIGEEVIEKWADILQGFGAAQIE